MILIVDDTPENLISLRKVLEKHNFEVDEASSGEEALKKILKKSYVLIILDVQMPGMDGFEVAEIISGHSKSKETAIIFLSALNTEPKFITKGYSFGALDYITKPVDIDILLLKVKTLYQVYEQKRQLKQMQKNLLEEIEIRKYAEHKKDEFISIASHELKTPLTSIKGYLQLLERSLKIENITQASNHLQKAQTQLEKLNGLIADLLDISKIESGKLKLNMASFCINKLIEDLLEIMKEGNPDIIFHVEGKCDSPIYGDEMRIEQVIVNFLTNALKYAPDGKEIFIKFGIVGSEFQLSVKDQGIGMSEMHVNNIFDKFYRVEENSHRFQGLGIGLYISSEIIKQHQGQIGVTSELGKGSEFYFKIPFNLTLL
ncbi:MAG: hybrid sensor histidine kinase/response regulator [Pedobacter sp.]|nr:MAG: hybrid sensor histidine kinase/response regulator [Pedobacter sp.]